MFRIKVRVFNAAGFTDSPLLGVILASKPSKPPTPIKDLSGSSASQITIDWTDSSTVAYDGCSILSYNV